MDIQDHFPHRVAAVPDLIVCACGAVFRGGSAHAEWAAHLSAVIGELFAYRVLNYDDDYTCAQLTLRAARGNEAAQWALDGLLRGRKEESHGSPQGCHS